MSVHPKARVDFKLEMMQTHDDATFLDERLQVRAGQRTLPNSTLSIFTRKRRAPDTREDAEPCNVIHIDHQICM